MTPEQLKILQGLAEQKRLRDMAELTRANAETAATSELMQALAREIKGSVKDVPAQDLAVISRWLGWAGQENTRLIARRNIQLAQAETARGFAAISDAKTQVIKSMLKQAEREELMNDRRKAEQNGREPDR